MTQAVVGSMGMFLRGLGRADGPIVPYAPVRTDSKSNIFVHQKGSSLDFDREMEFGHNEDAELMGQFV